MTGTSRPDRWLTPGMVGAYPLAGPEDALREAR